VEHAESQNASVQSRGQEESLAAINNLKTSYDASLTRLREAHESEVGTLQVRLDKVAEERCQQEGELAIARTQLAALTVRMHCPCAC
jgi:hypothetical protein